VARTCTNARTCWQLRVTSARPGTVTFELDIQKEHTNRLNILHGGTLAALSSYPAVTSLQASVHYTDDIKADLGGSFAVASKGLFATGVSTDINGESSTLNRLTSC
jgi:acyl-coenzyme A thioesterase 13